MSPLIETSRLLIRKFAPSDAADLYEYLSDPATYTFEPGRPISLDEARALTVQRSTGENFLAVVLKQSSKMIGHLYIEQIEPEKCRAWELGYIFNPKYQRRGFASEAAAALVEHVFASCHAHRIMARCDPRNPASWKLLEKIGFVREGHFKQAGCIHSDENGDPIWNDVFEYSRLEARI